MLILWIALILFNGVILSKVLNIRYQRLAWIFYLICFILEVYVYLQHLKPLNYYQEYGVTRLLNDDLLRKSYKQKMIQYHPDRNTDVSSEQFQTLKTMYEILKDEKKRQEYDAYGIMVQNNIDPLPTIKYRIMLTRVMIYVIAYLVLAVNLQQAKNKKKIYLIILIVAAVGDWQLYEDTTLFQQSAFFQSLTLFEFLVLYRICVSFLISIIIFQLRQQEKQIEDDVCNLKMETIQQLRREHEEYLNKQNSTNNKIINFIAMIGIVAFIVVQQMDIL